MFVVLQPISIFSGCGLGKSTHGIKDIKSALEDIYYWRSSRPVILFKTIKHFQSMGKTNNRCWQHRTQHRVLRYQEIINFLTLLRENTFPKTETFVTYYFPELSLRDQLHVWPGSGSAQCSNGIAIWLSVAECEKCDSDIVASSDTNIIYQQPEVFILSCVLVPTDWWMWRLWSHRSAFEF